MSAAATEESTPPESPRITREAPTEARISFTACPMKSLVVQSILARQMLESVDVVRPAFAGHNVRSLAAAVAIARHLGVPDDGFEIQMLHGMGDPIKAALRAMGLRLREYAPVGEIIPGMAYFVRRL